jgi:ribosomal protein RSM22 (predicted rRNA methylase)
MSQHNVNLRIYWLFYMTSHVFLVFILFLRYFLFLKNLSMEQVLVEPGTPHGFGIISQMRSHILWMEKRVSSLFLIEHSLAQELCYGAY